MPRVRRRLALLGLAGLISTSSLPMMAVGRSLATTAATESSVEDPPLRHAPAPRVASRSHVRPAPLVYVGRDGRRITVARVRTYLERRGSPMAAHAEAIVRSGIRYHFDPRTTVAVAGVESSFGLVRRGYNAWGWDVARLRWSSWNQAIWSWTRKASASYRSLARGDFWSAGPRYNPTTTWRHWAAEATAIFRAI
jgi:hypothetical protein